jgi:type I restriction enzyme S subunit
MRKYPKYKATEFEWFNEIPISWGSEKIKFQGRVVSGSTPETSKPEFWSGEITWATPVDFGADNQKYIYTSGRKITNEGLKNIGGKLIPKGAVVISSRAPIGLVAIAGVDLVTNQGCKSVIPKKVVNEFLFFCLKEFSTILENLGNETVFSELSLGTLKNFFLPIPTLREQRSIVNFLDYKTNQIDLFIANRQKQIELLKEQFKKKIYTALTKGLSNKVFKSTNLPWFPEIPNDWDLYKFNAAIKLHHGFQFRDNHFREEGVKVVKITQLKADGTLDLSEASFVEEKFLTIIKDRIIKSGDILMALTGGTIGKIICVDDIQEEVLQNYRVGKFVPKDSRTLDKDFMFWVLSSDFTFAQILFLQRETGQPNIGISDFSKMFFPMPNTIEEQRKISAYIIEQKTETDTLVSKYQKQIDLMQEYRTALISQAVTGKIDVREWEPKRKETKV